MSDIVKRRHTLKQVRTAELYFNPQNRKTFGNLAASALEAGFSKSYAYSISRDTPWINEIKRQLQTYEPDHIYRAFQDVAINGTDANRLKALELMGKHKGMFIDRIQQDIQVKFVNDVPRPESESVIEGEVVEDKDETN